MTPKQKYEKGAEWVERAGLLTLGAFVVQQLIAGAPTFTLILGFLISAITYTIAILLLIKA